MLVQNENLVNVEFACQGRQLQTDERGVVEVSQAVGEFLASTKGWHEYSGVTEENLSEARARVMRCEAAVQTAQSELALATQHFEQLKRQQEEYKQSANGQSQTAQVEPEEAAPAKPKSTKAKPATAKPKSTKAKPVKPPPPAAEEPEEPEVKVVADTPDVPSEPPQELPEDEEEAEDDDEEPVPVPGYSESTAAQLEAFLVKNDVEVPKEISGKKLELWKLVKENFDLLE